MVKVKTSTASKARSRVVAILLCLLVIVFVSITSILSSSETQKTVTVVRLKESVSANSLITEDVIEPYEMYYKEFANYGVAQFSDGSKRQAIVTWEARDAIVGKRYAAYYMRSDTVLFWDATTKEQTKKNSYLYSMKGELINIQMDTSDFGDMVVPGDTLNIRVSYTKVTYDLPSEEAYQLAIENGNGNIDAVTVDVTEMLFSEVTVLDMLNSEGQSIFDIYYSFIAQSKSSQSTLLKSDEFLKSVTPSTILLEVTSEEADRYMAISSKSPKYLMTLLPRTGSNSIIDSLSSIQSAIAAKSSKGG